MIGKLFSVILLAFFAAACGPATPTPEPQPRQPRYTNVLPIQSGILEAASGPACLGMFAYGLTCLDEAGWHTYDERNSPLKGNVKQISICPAGYFLIVHTFGATLFDGQGLWKDLTYTLPPGFDRAGCDGQNTIWLTHWDGLSRWEGQDWDEFTLDEITGGADVGYIQDIAVAADGTAWVVLTYGVARYAGEGWTLYQPGVAAGEKYSLARITLDSQGQPWVLHSTGLLSFDPRSEQWNLFAVDTYLTPSALALDPQGVAWIAGFSDLYALDPQGMFTDYASALKKQPLGQMVHDIFVDRQRRVWLATSWGLAVFGGEEPPRVYHMHTSDLASNDVFDVAVLEGGPILPELTEQPAGNLAGTLQWDDQPLSQAVIQVCAAMLLSPDLDDEQPCPNFPYTVQETTDINGKFELAGLLPGRYLLLARSDGRVEAGKLWTKVLDSVRVLPGETLDLGLLTLK